MKKRVIWKMFALTILTLGIYRLYWFIKTRKEMMALNPKVKIMSPLFFLIPIVIVIVLVIMFIFSLVQAESNRPAYCDDAIYTSYSESSSYATAQECEVNPPVWSIILFYAGLVFIWPLAAIWLWSYSKGVEVITKGKTSFAMSLVVLLLVPDGIDILIIQDGFNKLSPSTA